MAEKTLSQAAEEMVAPGTIGGAIKDVGSLIFGGGRSAPPMPSIENEPPLVPVATPTAAPTGAAPPPVASVTTEQPFVPPPPQTVKQSETRTQMQGGVKLDPALIAESQDARAKKAEATAKQTEIEAEAARKVAQIEEDKAQAIALERVAQENARRERNKYADEQLQIIRDAQKAADADKLPEENKLGQLIGIALGGLGRAMGGAMDVNDILAKDRANKLNAWKTQHERLRGRVADERNVYSLLMNKNMTADQAEAAAIQRINEDHASLIRGAMAESKAPILAEQGAIKLQSLREENAAIDQKLHTDAQSRWTQIKDDKEKTGGVDVEDRSKLIKLAQDQDDIKRYRGTRAALSKFQDLVRSGADGAAIAEFIAGKGGLEQGSFGPNFVALLKKRNIFGQGVEKLRETFKGGVDPALIRELETGLAAQQATALQAAKPAIEQFKRDFRAAGIDPQMVIGGETSAQAAAEAGATPSAYQGKQ